MRKSLIFRISNKLGHKKVDREKYEPLDLIFPLLNYLVVQSNMEIKNKNIILDSKNMADIALHYIILKWFLT
jgi:hypothetical protein